MRYGKVYCSKTKLEDEKWVKKIRDQGLLVDASERNSKGKEKEVDTALTADAVEYVCDSPARRQTVIIISGDRDYCPILRKIFERKQDWKVEMIAFESSISNGLREIENENANFKVISLDSLLGKRADACYIAAGWRPELHRRGTLPNTISLRFKETLRSPDELSQQYAEAFTLITRIPCFYYVCDWEPNAGRLVYIIGWVKDESSDGNNVFF